MTAVLQAHASPMITRIQTRDLVIPTIRELHSPGMALQIYHVKTDPQLGTEFNTVNLMWKLFLENNVERLRSDHPSTSDHRLRSSEPKDPSRSGSPATLVDQEHSPSSTGSQPRNRGFSNKPALIEVDDYYPVPRRHLHWARDSSCYTYYISAYSLSPSPPRHKRLRTRNKQSSDEDPDVRDRQPPVRKCRSISTPQPPPPHPKKSQAS